MAVKLTIKRPEGNIEIVDITEKFCGMTDGLFEKIKEATKNAGKGECLSYEITIESKLTEEDIRKGEADIAEQKKYYENNKKINNAMTLNGGTY